MSLKTISAQDKSNRIAAIRKGATADPVAMKTAQTPDGKRILNKMVKDTIEKFYVAADHFARHVCEKEIDVEKLGSAIETYLTVRSKVLEVTILDSEEENELEATSDCFGAASSFEILLDAVKSGQMSSREASERIRYSHILYREAVVDFAKNAAITADNGDGVYTANTAAMLAREIEVTPAWAWHRIFDELWQTAYREAREADIADVLAKVRLQDHE